MLSVYINNSTHKKLVTTMKGEISLWDIFVFGMFNKSAAVASPDQQPSGRIRFLKLPSCQRGHNASLATALG
jgi:hypothetical protein